MDHALEHLGTLFDLPVTVSILINTRIGLVVNRLRRKCGDKAIAQFARNLIKTWKNLVEKKYKEGDPAFNVLVSSIRSRRRYHSTEKSVDSRSKRSAAAQKKPTSSPVVDNDLAFNEARSRSRKVLLKVLTSGDLPDGSLDPEELSVEVEASLFEMNRGSVEKYMTAVHNHVFSLMHKKNTLRVRVLTGAVGAAEFAHMTTEDMATDELRRMRNEFIEQVFKQLREEDENSSDQYGPPDMMKCERCGKRNCTYTQMQTRSADEPMTTFAYCRECGKRWKF
uniref:Transcription elongation factor S-II n=1 Tax=Ascaris lumbricoides TaxID=6252 RepID=A0A0M3HEZ2_ASCLU